MRKYIGTWSFYKKTLLIAIPIMIQNLITNFVSLIDNIMVGSIGTEQMSGVAIANQLFFVFNQVVIKNRKNFIDLNLRTSPVFGWKCINRDVIYALVKTCIQNVNKRIYTLSMTKTARMFACGCPTTISVHNKCYMFERLVQMTTS